MAKKTGGDGDYEIGYRRPPAHTRFPPGTSGNPKGRPKGSRSVLDILMDALSAKVTLTEGGKTRRVSRLDAMVHRLISDGLKGDKPAVKLVLALVERHADSSGANVDLRELLSEDAEILAEAIREGLISSSEAKETPKPNKDHANEGGGRDDAL